MQQAHHDGLVEIEVSGTVYGWLADADILTDPQVRGPEQEWRAALVADHAINTRGSHVISVSRQAARELVDELAERARSEWDVPPVDRRVRPDLVDVCANRIRRRLTETQ